jgi:hypothetical protein
MRFAITSAKFLHPCCFLFFSFHTKCNFITAIAMFLLFSYTYFFLVFCRLVTGLLLRFNQTNNLIRMYGKAVIYGFCLVKITWYVVIMVPFV